MRERYASARERTGDLVWPEAIWARTVSML
jgi:hypothetical protein